MKRDAGRAPFLEATVQPLGGVDFSARFLGARRQIAHKLAIATHRRGIGAHTEMVAILARFLTSARQDWPSFTLRYMSAKASTGMSG